jgi:hypothetical protein
MATVSVIFHQRIRMVIINALLPIARDRKETKATPAQPERLEQQDLLVAREGDHARTVGVRQDNLLPVLDLQGALSVEILAVPGQVNRVAPP